MSLKICTAENMLSRATGTGFAQSWFPRMVAERMATSTRDGNVDRAPDAIPFIESSILWTNTTDTTQHLSMSVHRASRSLITSTPNLVVIDDAYTYDIGQSPNAPIPAGFDNGVGLRIKGVPSTTPNNVFARIFRETPDWVSTLEIGAIDPGDSIHLRYRANFSTPGEWRPATNPRHEASARWARLRLWAAPWLNGSI